MRPFSRSLRDAGFVLLWCTLGALTVAAFFITALFADFGALRFGDPGTVILIMPLLTAFVLGLLLVDYELVTAVLASLLTTGIAIGLVVAFVFSPVLAGVRAGDALFQVVAVSQVALSSILLFPLALVGTVVGRGIGEKILPPEDVRRRQKALMEETREWHDRLSGRGREPAPPEEKRP